MRRVLLWGPAVLYMAIIFYSSSQSDPAPALTGFFWDKLLHSSGYALLAILYAHALRGEGLAVRLVAVGAMLLTSLYAASDEIHQSFTPMRTMDIRDWVADSIGGMVGAAVYAFGRLKYGRDSDTESLKSEV
jgi:VanZ family protein